MFLLILVLLLVGLYLSSNFLLLLIRQQWSPLRRLPGPPSPSFFMGNLGEMHDQENTNLLSKWQASYGPNFTYRGFIGGCRLMTCDPVAVAHILGNAYEYPKPDFVRDSLATMAAGHDGILTSEGEMHTKQRKILQPAFSYSHLRSLTPIFWEKAEQLRDIWTRLADDPVPQRVDALSYLARATLDVIGVAGFGYNFNALSGTESNELADAFSVIFSTARKFRVMTILQVWFPILRKFRRNNATMVASQATMRRIGSQLVEERRKAAMDELLEKGVTSVGEKTILGKDILSVLTRSNLAESPSQQMSVNEILSQISTFIAAGHETTSNALTWCLYALVKNPEAQEKLRRELRQLDASGGHEQSQLEEAVIRCEYLDWVVRESLRLHAPVTSTMRVCMRDEDEVPVDVSYTPANPAGGYLDKHGVRRHTIHVKKWDIITIPIQAINNSEQLWGEDARVFRPERWAAPPSRTSSIPGLYSNILTFLNGNPTNGNRACIGYKFALLEIKIFLYVLMKDLAFSMDPSIVIEKRVNVVTRPFVKSEPELGNQLPLYIKRVSPDS